MFWEKWVEAIGDQKGYGAGVPTYIPVGYITDFASVPWPASMVITKDGDYNQSATTHDFLHTTQGYVFDYKKEIKIKTYEHKSFFGLKKKYKQIINGTPIYRFKKEEVDQMFLEGMEIIDAMPQYNISKIKRQIMYRAVRLAKWNEWKLTADDYTLREKWNHKI